MSHIIIILLLPLSFPPSPTGGFQVHALSWHSNGESLVLIGKEQLCLCYMDTEAEDKSTHSNVWTK